jgi:hypothetical protein
MKQKKAGRTSQRQREKKRYPFTESTKLIELVEKKHYGDVVKLIDRLKPYLADEGLQRHTLTTGQRKDPFLLTGLFFDLEKINGQRQFVIDELALFLKKVKDKKGLKCKQNVFFRYLSCPEHCNLAISENTLKAHILEAIQRLI